MRVGGAVAAGDTARVRLPSSSFRALPPLQDTQDALALARSRASRRRSRRSCRRLARSAGRSGGTCVGEHNAAIASSTKGAWIGSDAAGRASMMSSTDRPLDVIFHPPRREHLPFQPSLEAVDEDTGRPEASQLYDRRATELDERPERRPLEVQVSSGDVAELSGARSRCRPTCLRRARTRPRLSARA